MTCRRGFLKRLSGAAASSFLLPRALGAAGVADLHEYAAAQAKALLRGGSAHLRLLIPNGSQENLAPVVRTFREMTGITVTIATTPVDDINMELALSTLSGTGDCDVALPATFGLPDLVAAGALHPITDFTRKYEPEGFRENALYAIGDEFDGEIYGYQTDGDTYTMFYHRDLLEDPGENDRYADRFGEPLRAAETWQELDRQIAYFHRPDDGLCGGLLFRVPGYLAWEWWIRFHAAGYWPMSEDLTPQLVSDAGVGALEDMIRITEFLCPSVAYNGLFENWQRYARGDVFCNIGWGGSQKYLDGPRSKMRGRMIYGAAPGGLVDGELLLTPYFNWGWNYVVAAGSSAPELAYLFTLFAVSPHVSTLSVRERGGYFDPFREEHYADARIREIYSDEFLKVHRQSLRHSIPDLYLAGQGEYFGALNDWLDRALQGRVSVEEALKRIEQHWTLINNRSDPVKQAARWRALRQKYPEHLRERLSDL